MTNPQRLVAADRGGHEAVEMAHGRVVDKRVGNHDCSGVERGEGWVYARRQVSKWALLKRTTAHAGE